MIVFIVIVVLLIVFYIILRIKMKNFLLKYFGTADLKKAIEMSEVIDSNTPKSISSMERIYNDTIKKDFPDLNLNEIKRMGEKAILDYFRAIENKDFNIFNYNSDNVKSLIESKIDDLKQTEVHFDSIKFHNTVLNRYENKDGIATLYLQTSLEYLYKEGNSIKKKVQDRFKLEFIYIIDEEKVSKTKKGLGLNCPNCGSPITSLGVKKCNYCDTIVTDIVKRTWYLNNIIQF